MRDDVEHERRMHEATFQEWALAGAGLDELQTDQDINYMREAFLVDEACFLHMTRPTTIS